MIEKCNFCGATFTVECFGDGGICGACQEPIICPHCRETVRNERTTGTFTTTLVKAPKHQDSELSRYLGITDDEWEDMGAELCANTGNSGDMVYSYWFVVPEGTSDDILEKTGWKIGQVINDIPADVVDSDNS